MKSAKILLILGLFSASLGYAFINAGFDLGVMRDVFNNVDRLQPWRNFFRWVSHFGEAQYFVVLLALIWTGGWFKKRYSINGFLGFCKRYQLITGRFFITFGLASAVLHFLKFLTGRQRPSCNYLEALPNWHWFAFDGRYGSFPSGHAMAAVFLTVFVMRIWPKSRWWIWLWPIVVGVSRVALTKHYPSDVLFGYALAFINCAVYFWLNATTKLSKKRTES
ncbi:MAG: hypothetical protein CMM87_00205 [Rickettsiales bacterium]|nr:hypothetical protein [Rickettsiales bacterium]|tara:strand:- start:20112 stop:20774 length:663 start_codon:yes stop_codon:yes gene_type:complete